jgi:chromosome partitioning protein
MIIAFSNQKGGVGKTTTTLNLGAYLAHSGKKVLLVDMDPQANLSSGLDQRLQEAAQSIYDLISGNAQAKDVIRKTHIENLDIIPGSIELAGAEVELVNTISRESTLKELLSTFIKRYDLILIDCPPSLGLLTVNSLVAADFVVIPVQSEYYALEGLGQLLNTINLVKKKINSKLDILGIIITMYDARTNLAKDVAKELSDNFGDKVFNTIIPRNIRLSEAPSHGKTISEYDPTSQGAISYQSLAKELLKRVS